MVLTEVLKFPCSSQSCLSLNKLLKSTPEVLFHVREF